MNCSEEIRLGALAYLSLLAFVSTFNFGAGSQLYGLEFDGKMLGLRLVPMLSTASTDRKGQNSRSADVTKLPDLPSKKAVKASSHLVG